MHGQAILSHFSLSERDELGWGGESLVYALDGACVLRVYRDGADPAYIERLRRFYSAISTEGLPFETPVIHETGTLDGVHYAIEKRLPGSVFTRYLQRTDGPARDRALTSYVATADLIAKIDYDLAEFGEFLVSKPLKRATWPDYLRERARRSLSVCRDDVAADVPGLDHTVEAWEERLDLVRNVTAPLLAHGDYFPGNVFVNDGEVIAVIDFSPMTIGGDARLDVACALLFLELDDGYRPRDSVLAAALIEEEHGAAFMDVVDVYRTYYSLYFAPVKESDHSLYEWCVANLRRKV